MKILFIISDLETGGAEIQLYKLVEKVHEQYTIKVISLVSNGDVGRKLVALGIPVTAMGMKRGNLFGTSFFKLLSEIKKYKPDVVHTWMYHANLIGGLAAKLVNVKKIIWSIHQFDLTRQFNSAATLLVIKAGAFLSRLVPDQVICVSESVNKNHIAYGYFSKKMLVVPNGIDTNTFHFIETARKEVLMELGLADDLVLVGFFCRYHPIKDHAGFLMAFAKLKEDTTFSNVHAILAGGNVNNTNTELVQIIENLELSSYIHMLGNRDDMPRLMSSIDLFVNASFNEAFSLVLGEAMACMVPSVSTIDGDPAGIVDKKELLVPAGKPDEMEAVMHSAILKMKNVDSWTELRVNCRAKIVEHYGLDAIVEHYRQIWAN